MKSVVITGAASGIGQCIANRITDLGYIVWGIDKKICSSNINSVKCDIRNENEVMDAMNEQYETDWKRSTVCTFLTHLVEKGYIKMERKGRIFYYQSIINDRKFIEVQTRNFMDFFFDGS